MIPPNNQVFDLVALSGFRYPWLSGILHLSFIPLVELFHLTNLAGLGLHQIGIRAKFPVDRCCFVFLSSQIPEKSIQLPLQFCTCSVMFTWQAIYRWKDLSFLFPTKQTDHDFEFSRVRYW